jgi:hypothetical protein
MPSGAVEDEPHVDVVGQHRCLDATVQAAQPDRVRLYSCPGNDLVGIFPPRV